MAIPKSKSISFNEYIQDIVSEPTNLTSDWGLFVPLENNTHNISNLTKYNDIDIDINEISETIFEMDYPTVNTNIFYHIYTNIKSNLFVVSSFILYKVSSVCYND
jgi:hypothetical protein